MAKGVLVLQPPYQMSKEKQKKMYELFLKQKESGVIILPPGWNALLVPDDIEIVNPKYETNHHVKEPKKVSAQDVIDAFSKYMNPPEDQKE